MPATHSFTTSNTVGGIGESLFLMFASKVLRKSKLENVTRKKTWQSKGIDFLIDTIKYDVKFDIKAASTGNLALETISKSKDGDVHKEGWIYTTEADCIAYLTLKDTEWVLYFFTPQELKNLVNKYTESRKSVFNYGYNSEVVLVPLTDLTYKQTVSMPLVGEPSARDKNLFKKIHDYLQGGVE